MRTAMALTALVFLVAAGCGDAGPVEVVERFYTQVREARADSDEQALEEAKRIVDDLFVSPDGNGTASLEIVALMVRLSPMVEYRDMQYVLVEQGEDSALVRVTGDVVMSAGGMSSAEALTAEYPLLRVDGRWRISTLR